MAAIDTQFIVFNTVGAEMPPDGWPEDAFGLQGTVTPIEAGYYRATLRRSGGAWLIEELRILHDLPMAVPRVPERDDAGDLRLSRRPRPKRRGADAVRLCRRRDGSPLTTTGG